MWVTLNPNTVILTPNPNSGQRSKQLTEKTVCIKPTHLRPSLVISLRLPIESGISGMSLCWRSSEVIWTHFPISMDKEKTTTSNGLISILTWHQVLNQLQFLEGKGEKSKRNHKTSATYRRLPPPFMIKIIKVILDCDTNNTICW